MLKLEGFITKRETKTAYVTLLCAELNRSTNMFTNEPLNEKTCLCHTRTTNAQISAFCCSLPIDNIISIVSIFAISYL